MQEGNCISPLPPFPDLRPHPKPLSMSVAPVSAPRPSSGSTSRGRQPQLRMWDTTSPVDALLSLLPVSHSIHSLVLSHQTLSLPLTLSAQHSSLPRQTTLLLVHSLPHQPHSIHTS